ncbi:hypothetical protein M3Y94_00163600 [Aphelenchoides besseyi]|nr:hypothetical protein M3Y94_00163600 [Aphelenchoides besseyi]
MSSSIRSSGNTPNRLKLSNRYKNEGMNTTVLYHKHRQETVELRKKKRSDLYVQTRERNTAKYESATIADPPISSIFDSALIENLTSTDRNRQFMALQVYNHLFQEQENVETVYHLNLHNTFAIIFLQSDPFTEYEELSIVVLSQMMIETSRLPELFSMAVLAKLSNSLSSQKANVVTASLCILQNALPFNLPLKTHFFNFSFISTLCDIFVRFDEIQLKRQIAAVINVFFCEIDVCISEILQANSFVDFLTHVLRTEADEVLLAEIIEALANIAERTYLHADWIIGNKFLPIIVEFMDGSVIRSCFEFANSMVDHGKDNMAILCSEQFFTRIWNVATSSDYPIRVRREAFLLVAKFVKHDLLKVHPSLATELVEQLIRNLNSSMPFDIRVSSVLAIKHVLINDSPGIAKMCMSDDLLKSLCDLLTITKVESVIDVIVCLDKIMYHAVSHGMGTQIRLKLEEFNVTNKFAYLLKKSIARDLQDG